MNTNTLRFLQTLTLVSSVAACGGKTTEAQALQDASSSTDSIAIEKDTSIAIDTPSPALDTQVAIDTPSPAIDTQVAIDTPSPALDTQISVDSVVIADSIAFPQGCYSDIQKQNVACDNGNVCNLLVTSSSGMPACITLAEAKGDSGLTPSTCGNIYCTGFCYCRDAASSSCSCSPAIIGPLAPPEMWA
jgi:hypothetical protein